MNTWQGRFPFKFHQSALIPVIDLDKGCHTREHACVKLVSWNVNGIRAARKKGFDDYFATAGADLFCLQETKAEESQVDQAFADGYHCSWNSAAKKGYSGSAVFSRQRPLAVTLGMGIDEHDREGRVITLEFPEYFVVNVYTPNAQNGLRRLAYRMEWDLAFRNWLVELDASKPVLVCGDLNVAHKEIDLARPRENAHSPGFSQEEREGMTRHLEAGFTDSFRHLYPDLPDQYSWWSYRAASRERNIGWRIDYWLVSDRLAGAIEKAEIHSEIGGSDHCPVVLEISL
jgi:exodeoxyribonuclease-3